MSPIDRRIQKCCEMLVHNAVISKKWSWLYVPLDRLMECYREKGEGVKRQYVAYWVLSLMLPVRRSR